MERIFLLEDDEALGRGIALALQTPDRVVAQAATLAQARALLQGQDFALLILDVNLPDGSGLDLVRELRAAAALVVWERLRTRRLMARLDDMLTAALEGRFTDTHFDESRLSALESRLAQYLAADTSARRLAQQKDQLATLVSDISHQTRTPVANLQLYAQLLAEQPLTPRGQECAAALTLVLALVGGPLWGAAMQRMFWFFTYRFILWPIGVALPLFAVLGVVIPLASSRAARRLSVVDRLRQE